MEQKERIKRRIRAYENFNSLWVCMLETEFKHIFNRMAQEKGIKTRDTKGIIEACNEEECLELNLSLDCYQIDKGTKQIRELNGKDET